MVLKIRLVFMQFLQFFIWGSWLLTIGAYWFQNKGWSGSDFGAIFSTMGIASLFMPALAGIIADRWISSERLYGCFHLIGAAILFYVPNVDDPKTMFIAMLVSMMFYMPTLSLATTVSYSSLKNANLDVVKEFPPIRVWGTVGFIAALWFISLTGLETSAGQFYVASAASFLLGLYSFSLPSCPPLAKNTEGSFMDAIGLSAFSLFKNPQMALFFFFAILLGAALQLTNAYGDTFLHDFASLSEHKDSFAVKYPAVILSISQISETLFILAIPFFLKHFGIKKIMLISMLAWVLRFGLLAFGNPSGGLWMIVLSCIVYGIAFDFFNISGSLFVEGQVEPRMRASGQGLFVMMSNGVGAVFGSRMSGLLIDNYFMSEGHFNWQGIWLSFAAYAGIIALLFLLLFRQPSPKNPLPN